MNLVIRHLLFVSTFAFTTSALAVTQFLTFKPTDDTFTAYTYQYGTPELFYDNNDAFTARIKLLDQAPAGAVVKVLTFHFDNGLTTRRLAAHMCKAAQRGVKVEFMADSKTGDRPGIEDAFDSSEDYKINEETYQFMANCGVTVVIHNHIPEFDKLTISRIKIPKFDVKGINFTTSHKVLKLVEKIADILNEEFKDVTRTKLNDYYLGSFNAYLLTKDLWDVFQGIKDGTGEDVDLLKLFREYNLTSLSTSELNRRLVNVRNKIVRDPELKAAHQKAREFNRLNHRKLFWVRYKDQVCFLLGGRNLGDHYLLWNDQSDSFVDGDVLYCSHHAKPGDEHVVGQAAESFNDLWSDKSEGHKVTHILPNPNYQFKYLLLDRETFQYIPRSKFNNKLAIEAIDDKDLTPEQITNRTIPKAILMRDHNVAIHGSPLVNASNWRIRTSTWDVNHDNVRKEFYKAIDQERQEVYIETAYSEMDDVFRQHIELALRRGVNVTLVTNSFFVLDAGSKAIRLTMGLWVRKLLNEYSLNAHMTRAAAKSELDLYSNSPSKYRGVFTYKIASIMGGHMIHFKGAGFKCQEVNTPNGVITKKTFLIGSHNFHPRSGYSDKEHAIFWDQPAAPNCANDFDAKTSDSDMIDYRKAHYGKLNVMYGDSFLKSYDSLYYEITDALASGELSPSKQRIAKGLLKAGYDLDANGKAKMDQNGNPKLRTGLQDVLEVLEAIGLRDFLGTVL